MPLRPRPTPCPAVYFPGLEAYLRLTQNLEGSTRMRWGASCAHQYAKTAGWRRVFWDLAAAKELIATYYPQARRLAQRQLCGMLAAPLRPPARRPAVCCGLHAAAVVSHPPCSTPFAFLCSAVR